MNIGDYLSKYPESKSSLPRERKLSHNVFVPSLRALRDCVATGNLAKMKEGLREILQRTGQELELAWAQLMLIDNKGTITFAVTNPQEPDSPLGLMLRQVEVKILGTRLDPGSVFSIVPERYAGQILAARQLDCGEGGRNLEKGSTISPLQIYDLFSINLDASDKESIVGEKLLSAQAVPTFIDLDAYPALESWLENVIVTGNRWPHSPNLPQMSGFVVFAVHPKGDFEELLFGLREDISLLSWLILYSAFVFQVYALSQASAEEPRRLREELRREGWMEILHIDADKYLQTKDKAGKLQLENSMTQVLGLESEFVKRQVLKDVASYVRNKPLVAGILRNRVTEFLKALSPSDRDSVLRAFGHTKAAYPYTHEDALNTYLTEKILPSALRHVETLYPHMDEDALSSYLTDEVLPAVTSLVPGLPGSVVEWPFEEPKELLKYSLSLSALEDAYVHANPEVQTAICDILQATTRSATADGKVYERLIASLLLAIAKGNGQQLDRLAQLAADALLAWEEQEKIPLEFANGLFVLLKADHRQAILEKLPAQGMIYEQLRNINDEQSRLKSELQSQPPLRFPQLISFVSSKGGTGKTLLALGLASFLANDHKVCLIDLDFFGPTLNYVVGRSGLRADSIFLNDYIWAKYLPQLAEKAKRDKQTQEMMDNIFGRKNFWKNRFERLSEDERGLLDKLLVHTGIPNLKVVACSPNEQFQDMMLPFLDGGMPIISAKLYSLILDLRDEDYEYVIFDCPAELKELALCATELSTLYRGKNMFVTTLFEPSIKPILEMLSSGYYVKGENYLLINKVRQLDYKYIARRLDHESIGNKQAFVDYRSALETDSVFSTALLDMLINIDHGHCGYVPWLEYLDRILTEHRPFSKDNYLTLAEKLEGYLEFITAD